MDPLKPEEIKALLEEQMALTKQLRDENEKLLAQNKNTQIEWTEKMQTIQNRLDQIETKLSRPPVVTTETEQATKEARARTRAFMNFCRHGLEGMEPEEKKLLAKDTLPTEKKVLSSGAGIEFLASPEMTAELIKGVIEFSPIRSIARVRSTSAKSVKIRKRTGTFAAAWVAKTGTRSETVGLTYGLEEAPNHELYALVDVPMEDLEDSDFNLESELNMEFSEQFGVAEGKSFVSGNAVGEAEGLLTNAAVAYTPGGHATLLQADGLIDLFFAIKDAYARNATWVMKRGTIGAARKLKGSDNNYLWQPGLAGAMPATILDRPYVEAVDMPAIAADSFPILFGDFRRGYVVVDRIMVSVLRDPFTQASTGSIRFHARKRVGGQVMNAEAIRKLKISTA